MSFIPYSQNDLRWKNHVLGYGPALGTIGAFGCVNTVKAMIATFAGYPTNPAQMDEAFTAKKIFTRDPTGTYDFLPDNALALLWPTRFKFVGSYAGLRSDLIKTALPTPDTYAELHISTKTVPTHRVWVIGGTSTNWTIADPWDGKVKSLSAYGGAVAVSKTILTKELPQPVPVKPAAPIVAPPIDPPPVVVAPPVDPVIIPVDPVVVTPPIVPVDPQPMDLWKAIVEFFRKFFATNK